MSSFEPAAKLQPYLNPAYWDGHMIADGHPKTVDPKSFTGSLSIATMRFARQTLRDRLELMHTYTPLHIYGKGDTFDPEEWPIGTVALFDQEILRADSNHNFRPTSLKEPPRPTDLHPNLGISEYGVTVCKDTELDLSYHRAIEWGVTTPTRVERKAFYSILTGDVWKDPDVRVSSSFLPKTVPIHIGETYHPVEGQLARTNVLHVCMMGSGERKKQRSPVFGMFGRLATGNA